MFHKLSMLKSPSKISGLFPSINYLKLTKNGDLVEFGERCKRAIFTDYSRYEGFLNVKIDTLP